jgi:hypothetical protein
MKRSMRRKYSWALRGPVNTSGKGSPALSGWSRMPRM